MSDPTITEQLDVIPDNSPPALSIDTVLKEMEEWRIRKGKGMRPIPEELWDKVIALAKIHSPSKICALLGISTSQYQKRLTQLQPTASSPDQPVQTDIPPDAPSLVEWDQLKPKPLYRPNQNLSPHTVIVEFCRADGKMMKIHTTSTHFSSLIQLFFDQDMTDVPDHHQP